MIKLPLKELRYKTVRISYIHNYFIIFLMFVLLAIVVPYIGMEEWWSKLVILGVFSVVLILLFEPEAERALREYFVGNTEVTKVEGILTKRKMAIPYQSVADVRVIRGVLARIFNFGDVVVKGMKEDIVIKGVNDPEVVAKIIENKIARMKGIDRHEKRAD